MARYIDNTSCPQCDEYINPYGCVNAGCPIRVEYDRGMAEMTADFDVDKRREDRLLEEE